MSVVRVGLVALAAALSALLGLSESAPGDLTLLAGLLIVGAVLVELTSLPLDQGRVFSLAGPVYLTLAWLPETGLRVTIFALLIALTLRSLSPRAPTNAHKTFGFLADFSSGSVALGFPLFLKKAGLLETGLEDKFVNMVLFLVFDFWMTSLLLEQPHGKVLSQQLRLVPVKLAAFLLAPLALTLSQNGSFAPLLIIPILLALNLASKGLLQGEKARKASMAEQKADRAEKAQQEMGTQLARKERDLKRQLSERELLEELGRAFVKTPNLASVFKHSAQVVRRVVKAQSVAFFLYRDSQLETSYCESPREKEAESAHLLGLTEPAVETCWDSRRPVILDRSYEGEKRLFPGECSGVVFPLGKVGVLYIGCAGNQRLSREVLRDLAVVADQTLLAAITALQRDELQEALTAVEESNRQLEESRRRLESVLQAGAELSKTVEPELLLKIARESLPKLVPAQSAGGVNFSMGKQIHTTYWPGQPTSVFREVHDVCQQSGLPLKIDDFRNSRFPASPFTDCLSLLAVPLKGDQISGVMMVAAKARAAFTTHDQDALAALAYQLQAVLSACNLFEQLKLSQAQLVQSSKMAAVGQLSAGVAHEINTPLAAIRIAVQSAALNAERGQIEKCCWKLERAEKATKQAQEITNKLLIFARSSNSEAAPISLKKVANQAVEMVAPQLANDGVRVVPPEGDVPAALANQNEIHQVVLNLLLNARDALVEAAAADPTITIGLQEQDNQVELHLYDNGPGIPNDVIDRIFEPFFTTKPVGQGTGLGLSVSQTLVESYHGTLSAHNQDEGGACFVLTLPKA